MNPFSAYPKEENLYGIFNDSFPPIIDGVTLTVENYARWILKNGKTPCIVTPWNPVKTETPYQVMRFLSLPIQNRHPYRYGYPKLDPFIWKRLKNTDFKILHAHCPFSSGRLAVYVKKKQNVPLIGTFHSKYKEDLQHSFQNFPFCVPIIMKRILNFFNACDEVWIPQKEVEETVRKYGYKGPLTVVENGNDFASLVTGDLEKHKIEAKKRLGFDSKDLNLLFVGQHIWEKGLDTIIKTMENLAPESNIKINFIGDGYAAKEVAKIIKEKRLESLKLLGLITDRKLLSDYYAASDLFFFPSMYDNAPLVVREAAAMGTPSLLLEKSTASQVISNDKNGFVVNNNPVEIAGIIKALNLDRQKLTTVGKEAKETLVRSWEDVVEEVLDRYDVIVKNHKR